MERVPGSHRDVTVFDTWPNSVVENFHELPSRDRSRLGAWCYTDRLSYVAGDTIRLHTCTTGKTYDVSIYRDGASRTDVFSQSGISGQLHETPLDCSVNGCGWPVALEVNVGDWKSGGYIVHIRAYSENGSAVDHHFPFAVRAAKPSATNAILLLTCTATWVAYNDWGGSNYYEGIEGENRDRRAFSVHTQRPFSRGFAWLPEGAPRIPLREPPPMGAAIRHPHMEWAYANGFSKKYASSGWATYDRHFLRWAEARGFVVDVATQHDIHQNASILQGYSCIAIVGHDEYWSWDMRDAVDAYVEAGGHVARFAGNFKWQVRVEDGGTRQVCYKGDAERLDPVRQTDRKHLLACSWEDMAVRRPGASTFGLNGSLGVYSGWGGCAPRASGGFTVYRPEHWVFEGTDLYYGDQLGAQAKVFGYEVDGCDYT
ncbi:MAG TPA: N,N-dimethylformamidase beta subunit family domain-containing protein, partial [Candidatus Binatia bacterium]|nr:N,N-dimethylformamidase beta subunit family domain-containing protein [Candidatus Binatia bacterium]